MKTFLTLCCILFTTVVAAQTNDMLHTTRLSKTEQFKNNSSADWNIRWKGETLVPRVLSNGLSKAYQGTPESIARQFLKDHNEFFAMNKELNDVQFKQSKTHRGVTHVTFNQYYNGMPVEGAQYKVHIRADGRVDMANGYYYPDINISGRASVSPGSAMNTALGDLEIAAAEQIKDIPELVVYPVNDTSLILAYKIHMLIEEPYTNWIYFIEAQTGEILEKQNQLSGITGTGKVYPKHPDNSTLTIKNLYRLAGNSKLDGTYVKVYDDSGAEANESSHNFQYDPTHHHFDEVSLYYHVDNFRHNFIEGLDVNNNLFTKLLARARSNSTCPGGSYGACYNHSNGDLYFGNGLPNAREDKVIYHEYSHAVVRDIEGDIRSSSNGEEGAISEGVPDYFAGSFTGRNEIGEYVFALTPNDIRDMEDPIHSNYTEYDTDNNNGTLVSAHDGASFFSSILWDIRNDAGISTAKTDELVFDALFRISADPDFLEFRDAMMAADVALNSGAYKYLVQDIFAENGVGVYSANQAVITGSTYLPMNTNSTWNTSVSNGTTPFSIVWYRKDGFGSWYQVSTGTSYTGNTGTTTFELRVDVSDSGPNLDGEENFGVAVYDPGGCQICKEVGEKTPLPKNFSLQQNYPNPFNPSTSIKFELPEASDVSLKVYNLMGQQVATLVNGNTQAGFHEVSFNANGLSSGLYIAKLQAVSGTGKTFIKELKMQLIK